LQILDRDDDGSLSVLGVIDVVDVRDLGVATAKRRGPHAAGERLIVEKFIRLARQRHRSRYSQANPGKSPCRPFKIPVVRHFEYVGGTSSKFWEISRSGTEVTVTFGRIGTNGQAQVKDLGTESAAAAHVDKLIAEKVGKGYIESGGSPSPAVAAPVAAAVTVVSGPRVPPPVAAPPTVESPRQAKPRTASSEDVLVIPSGWRRSMHPRRTSHSIPPLNLDLAKAKARFDELRSRSPQTLEKILNHPKSDQSVVMPIRALLGEVQKGWFGGKKAAESDATPAGAAGLAVALSRIVHWNESVELESIADLWVGEQSLAFAVAAAALSADIVLDTDAMGIGTNTEMFIARSTNAKQRWFARPDVILSRLRHHLALATQADYEAALAAATPLRRTAERQRQALSYLFPGEADWVADDVKALGGGKDLAKYLLASVSTKAQLDKVAKAINVWEIARDPGLVYSAVEGVGSDAAEALATWFDAQNADAETQKRMASALAVIPTDEAFNLLLARADKKYVQPALVEASERFPSRAIHLLSAAASRQGGPARIAAEILRSRVLSDRELATTVAKDLPESHRRTVEAILEKSAAAPPADQAKLHPVLVSPPWVTKRAAEKPIVVEGLKSPNDTRIDWLPGERDKWLARRGYGAYWKNKTWTQLLAEYQAGALRYQELAFFALAPPEVVRQHLATFRPQALWDADAWLERIVGVYELAALPVVRYATGTRPTAHAGLLLPFESTEIATLMADWYVRLKSLRPLTLKWFARHPGAARRLIPAAVGKQGAERRLAETALRVLAQVGNREDVLQAASEYGADARRAVEATLNTDPLAVVPPRIPLLPTWADPGILPQILLADRSAALPPDSARHVCTMLAISKPGDEYPGIEVVVQSCDRASLAEFAWALFQQWELAGMPSKEAWVLDAMGYVGDDETVRRLSPLIRAWPGEGGHARAVTGLDVLASIGTDVALMHLNGIADKAKFKGLKARAQEKINEVAAKLGLTAEELADRLVPDLGLDDDGSMTLDFGPRKFTVGFDEQLKPYVTEEGTRRKELPKPGPRDDATLAPDAYKAFAALKKDARTLAADQIRRFERAMVLQRRWDLSQVRGLFIEHPLLWHISRRLVWASFDGSGHAVTAFRVAEDRTLADADDKELLVEDSVRVGIPHPLHLGDGLRRWSDLFADYEILQPFAQLGRDVFRLSDVEKGGTVLEQFKGVKVETVKVLGLERFGWERGEAQDAGIQGWMFKKLPHDRAAVVGLDPGIIAGAATEWKEQTLQDVWINNEPTGDWSGGDHRQKYAVLDEVTASEIIRDLRSLSVS